MPKKKAAKKNQGTKKRTEQPMPPLPPVPLPALPASAMHIPMQDGWLAAFGGPKSITSRRFADAFGQLLSIFRDDESAFLIAQMKCMEAHKMLAGIMDGSTSKSSTCRTILQMKDVFQKLDEIREILRKQ